MIMASDCNCYHLEHHIRPILNSGDVSFRDDDMYVLGFWADEESHVKEYEDRFKKTHHVVIHWAGSDVITLKSLYCRDRALRLLSQPEIRHFSSREKLSNEVSEVIGRECQVIATPTTQIAPEPFPLPEKFAVGVYYPGHRRDLYGLDCVDEVIRKMPDVPFYLYYANRARKPEIAYRSNVTWLGRIDDDKYLDYLKTVSVLLRLTSHDGTSYSMVEHQCAGRYCVTEQRFDFCQVVRRDVDDVLKAINYLQTRKLLWGAGAEYWRAYNNHDKFRKAIKEILR